MRTAGRLAIASAAFVLALPVLAQAQTARKAGIVIGFPSAFGVLWHASDKIAIRPEFSISGSSSDLTSPTLTSHTHGWTTGFGLSALFYTHADDHLRTYIVPRFSYAHSSTSSDNSSISAANMAITTDTYGGSGSFGAQYGLGDRFAVFGELGFEVAHRTTSLITGATGNNWATRGGVGVVFYP